MSYGLFSFRQFVINCSFKGLVPNQGEGGLPVFALSWDSDMMEIKTADFSSVIHQ